MSLDVKAEEISQFIWDWIKTTYKIPHGNAQETGITSYIIYKMFRENSTSTVSSLILDFDKIGAKESISGADFFLVLEYNHVVYKLLVQAKRLSKAEKRPFIENTYNEFKHSVKHGSVKIYQYFLLLRYINSSKCPEGTLPYYMFYNSSFDQPDNLASSLTHASSRKVNFLWDIDRKYSYSSNNREVFGILLTNAYEFLNLFGSIPISPSINKLTPPTFKQVLQLESTVTLQEFIRRVTSKPPTGGNSGGSPTNRTPDNPESNEGYGNTVGKELNSKSKNNNINFVNINEKIFENIKSLNSEELDIESPNNLKDDATKEKNITVKSSEVLKDLNFEELMHKYKIKFNIKNISKPPEIKDLTTDSLKRFEKLKDKQELNKQVTNIIENNYDRLPIFIVSIDESIS